MKGWLQNGTLTLVLCAAIAGLATGCGGAYESSVATRGSQAGASAGGAIGAAASGASGAIGAAGSAGGALGAAGSAVDAAGASGHPVEPCPTKAVAGEQLQGFDSSESIEGWNVVAIGEGSIDWVMAERFSCSGALHCTPRSPGLVDG